MCVDIPRHKACDSASYHYLSLRTLKTILLAPCIIQGNGINTYLMLELCNALRHALGS